MKYVIYILIILLGSCNKQPKPYYQQERKKADTLNVKDFGAVGDGIIDDWFSVQAACLYAQGGDIIYFPKGIYRLSSFIVVGDMVAIQGGDSSIIISSIK